MSSGAHGLGWFAIFYGLDWVATVPPTVRLTGEAFGRENTGVVYGWIAASHQLGASLAAFGAGAIRTGLGDYSVAFWIAGGLLRARGRLVPHHRPAHVRQAGGRADTGVYRERSRIVVIPCARSARPYRSAGQPVARTSNESLHASAFSIAPSSAIVLSADVV